MEENTNKNNIILALDISTKTIGVTLLLDDGSDYGKIIELTHISPRIPTKIKGIEELFLKKKIFESFILKYKDYGINEVIIEEPLISSSNILTCAVLLRFNGMISDSIYNILHIVPEYISSYDARKYSFPELMAIRKYGKDGEPYGYQKIMNELTHNKLTLFGSYSWEVDKKTVIQSKVAEIFPDIQWLYDANGELKKENFDATDSYVVCLAHMNKRKYGELTFKIENITSADDDGKIKIFYDVKYWDKTDKRTTYVG